MTTSNSTDFSMTRDQIISDTLWLLGVIAEGEDPSANQITRCSRALNRMIKAWQAQGIHLWTYQEGTIFLTDDYQSYSLASSSTDIAGNDVVFSRLTADGSSTTLTVGSTVGMNALDNVGIVLDDGTLQWTTVVSVDSSTQLTINTALTGDASSGNNVFVFTNRIDRPLEITSARFRNPDGTERPMEKQGRDQFMAQPNKAQSGPALIYYYSPKVSTAKFYVWPVCEDVGGCINISYLRRIQDFDASGDTPDLPQEWYDPIVYNLAVRVAPAFGISTQKLDPDIRITAANSLLELQLWDAEEGSLNIVPNYRDSY